MNIAADLTEALEQRFADRWKIATVGDSLRMFHHLGAAPSARRHCPGPREITRRMRRTMTACGLVTSARLLPIRWNRDTELTISAIQALDPWLKDAEPRMWCEGFLAQPVVRNTGERDDHGHLIDGYLTAFTNLSYVQRITAPKDAADLLDHWFTALSAVGLHAGRLTLRGSLKVWQRSPVAGITLFIDCDGRGLGDLVLLWNAERPAFMAVDLGSGLERLRWYLGGGSWSRAAFGDLADHHEEALLDAVRTATLLLMAGIRPAHRGPGASVRSAARAIDQRLARTGLGRLVRHQVAYWRGIGMTGPGWAAITTQLENEVLRKRSSPHGSSHE